MAKNNRMGVADVVRDLISPTVTALGYAIWDVEYVKEGSEWYLRVTIDRPEGIEIDDCEAVSRAIDPLLDEADPIEDSYRLEVSSPGVERELRTHEHYVACVGEVVLLRFYKPVSGAKSVQGVLVSHTNEEVTLCVNGENVVYHTEDVAKANTVYDFSADFASDT